MPLTIFYVGLTAKALKSRSPPLLDALNTPLPSRRLALSNGPINKKLVPTVKVRLPPK